MSEQKPKRMEDKELDLMEFVGAEDSYWAKKQVVAEARRARASEKRLAEVVETIAVALSDLRNALASNAAPFTVDYALAHAAGVTVATDILRDLLKVEDPATAALSELEGA